MMSDLDNEKRYTGQANALLDYGTDPWLRDEHGQDIDLSDWMEMHGDELVECSGCGSWEIVDGAFAPVNGSYGIEACDEANIHDGDFAAALAVREKVNPHATIWYHPNPKEQDDE